VHRDERYYPEPEEFRPQRFFDNRADTAVWLPFGGGIRRCLGATFAQVEMRTVLGEVLRRVELAPTAEPAEPVRVRHVTLVPRLGAMVTVRHHITAEAAAEHIVTT
jgi:cytochrome P450